MKRRYPRFRKHTSGYKALFLLIIGLSSIIIILWLFWLIGDGKMNWMKRAGMSAMQQLYLTVSSDNSSLFDYSFKDKRQEETLLSSMADSMPINYYANHQGKIIASEDIEEHFEDEFTDEAALLYMAEQENKEAVNQFEIEETLPIEYMEGGVVKLPEAQESKEIAAMNPQVIPKKVIESKFDLTKMKDLTYLMSNYYIVDEKTSVNTALFPVDELISMDLTVDKTKEGPQILIYHTHASEAFVDSRPGVQEDTVVGLGSYLTELLTKKGFIVYHDTSVYDTNRNKSYTTALPNIEKILSEHPDIQVTIDIHRDAGNKRVTQVNGKDTAQVMFFNGLSRNKDGPIPSLPNPNQKSNLAFSFQTSFLGRSLYPGFVLRNYLKNYRYNLHLRPCSMLVEVGTVNNTVSEAYNAMEPLAELLTDVLW